MLIAVGSKKIGEMQIVPLLEEMGFTPEQYLFYHGNSAEPMKKAVLNTTKEWRNVMVIVATTTIEVAINIELNFLSRWLFTSSHGLLVSLSSELMQLLARVPRGPDAAARADQLTDHRIHVVFNGDHPPVAQPKGASDSARLGSLKRKFDAAGEAALDDERRAADARLALTGVASTVAPSFDGGHNTLRASVQGYRNQHVGQVHVR